MSERQTRNPNSGKRECTVSAINNPYIPSCHGKQPGTWVPAICTLERTLDPNDWHCYGKEPNTRERLITDWSKPPFIQHNSDTSYLYGPRGDRSTSDPGTFSTNNIGSGYHTLVDPLAGLVDPKTGLTYGKKYTPEEAEQVKKAFYEKNGLIPPEPGLSAILGNRKNTLIGAAIILGGSFLLFRKKKNGR